MPEPQPDPSGELAGGSEEVPRVERAGLADERFATNVRETRERLKMSQGELARQMAERGFPYYQQTVRRIEEGRRKVSVGEAKALADILGNSMERLTWPGRAASAAGFLDMTIGRAEGAWGQIAAWTVSLLHKQRQLEISTGEAERAGFYGSAKVGEIVREGHDVLKLTPEKGVEQGRRDYQRMLEEGEDPDDEPDDLPPLPHPEENTG